MPTYNRSDVLGRALRGLLDQSLPDFEYEVVVVDDGSTDDTRQVIAEVGAPPSRLRYFRQENRGPAAARNYGVREARGEIILFTGDDCLADHRLLEEHLRTHWKEGDVGVVGHVAWHPDLKITGFMTFLEDGVQFGFKHIEDPEDAPYWAFYTSNCSLRKRRLEEAGGFDEDFAYAAFEDTELSYRLEQRGMRLVYRSEARTYHYHPVTLEHYLRRQRLAGRAAVTFFRKHPELQDTLGVSHAGHPVAAQQLYRAAVEYAYSLGIREALRGEEAPPDNELDALYADPALATAGRAWAREVSREDDSEKQELFALRHDMRQLRGEYDRITSRRLYRWSESLARATWWVLFRLGYPWRARS
jgi:GT2 family glycosyltransferase